MSSEKNNNGTPSVLDQWRKRKKKRDSSTVITPKPADQQAIPSNGQKRLWLLQQLFPENPFYQYGHVYQIKGKLNPDLLTKSFQALIDRHEVLRTNFVEEGQRLILAIAPTRSIQIRKINLREVPEKDQEAKAYQVAKEEGRILFNLATDLLVRVSLISLSETNNWVLLSMHHIIGDRPSHGVITKELFRDYQKRINLEPISKNDLNLQYTDFAYWQRQQKTKETDLAYWLDQLSGELPLLFLPSDHKRPQKLTFKGELIKIKLDSSLSDDLRQLAKTCNTTLYVLLLSAYKVLLYRYTNQTDLLVGSPFSNRDKVELEQLIGFFNETVVLRSTISPDLPFKEFVANVKELMMNTLAHKNVPFDQLVSILKPERHGNVNPIFQVMYLYHTTHHTPDTYSFKDIKEVFLDFGTSKFDLTLFINDQQSHLECTFEYSLELFEPSTIKRMLAHLKVILQSVVADSQLTLSRIPLLTAAERQKILIDWNDKEWPLPDYSAIHHLIEEMAEKYPDKLAVTYQQAQLSYSALNEQANSIAMTLMEAGVEENSPVGLYADRSVAMIAGILGILKAGAAYLPIDPDYPPKRIEYMLQDAHVSIILAEKKWTLQESFPTARVITIESAIQNTVPPDWKKPVVGRDHLAYLIYTSGSTGLPKGVPVKHKHLLHSTLARLAFYPANPSCFLLMSSFSFDSSVAGIFWTLCSGGHLLLPPKRIEQDVKKWSNLIFEHQVSHTLLLPSLYYTLLNLMPAEQLRSLQNVMVAGEACPIQLVKKHFELLPNTALYNEYGPTEATVWCIAHQIQPDEKDFVPIGKAIANTDIYILDEQLQAVPIGVSGELYIGGSGLSEGYLNRPELTTKKFIPNPFKKSPQQLIYKTGDLARFHADGIVEFLGRVDQQVKIRGFRVEPQEIQTVLLSHHLIKEAIVVVDSNSDERLKGSQRLVAYVSSLSEKEMTTVDEFLTDKLPAYMIPAVIIPLMDFPRLPNGKIDRKGLPSPGTSSFKSKSFVAPKSALERRLAKIWEEVLNIERIGITDNFFFIGGDSILSIQLFSKMEKEMDLVLPPSVLFQHPTIAAIAALIQRKQKKQGYTSSLIPLRDGGNRPPLFCIHGGGAHVFFYQAFTRYLPEEQPVFTLQAPGLDGSDDFHPSIADMARHYIEEIKTVQPEGPYHILGTCFSNAVALEMANQLHNKGEQIARLFIIDSGPVHLFGDAGDGKSKTFVRFFDMLKRGDFNRIKRKILGRFKKPSVLFVESLPEGTASERNLKLTIDSLNQLYAQYHWKPYAGKIHFIRSSEFHGRADKKYHLTQWRRLAKSGLDIHVVPGHHKTLFEEPEVRGLAEKVNQCIATVNT